MPGNRRVFGEVALDGGDSRVFDVLRRGEMRLAGAEIDHVDALRAQLVGLGHHCHGGGRFDAVDSIGKSECFGGRRGHAFLFLFFSCLRLYAQDFLHASSRSL